MSTISGLIERQQELFTSISRTVINLKKKGEANITETYVKARLSILTDNWAAFQHNHTTISDQKTEATKKLSYFVDDLRTQCEEMVIENQSILNDYLARFTPAAPMSRSADSHLIAPGERSVTQSRSLPKLELPHFSGIYKEWTPFRDLFHSIVIANSSISDVEKFHYLKMSVTGEAAQLISNMSVTVENFELAWRALSDRYDNRRVLVNTQLELLFSIRRIQRESANELKRLHGTTNEVLGALSGLKCDTKNWDPIIVYWVSRKFDPNTLWEWELHTGNSTETLTVTQLNEFLVKHIRATEAIERVAGTAQVTSRNRDGKVQVHQASIAATVCQACQASHFLQSCPTYLAKTLEQRKAFVTQQRLCFNCLGSHHRKSCRCTRRCVTCKTRHHSTLHEASKPVVTTTPSKPEQPPSTELVSTPTTSHLAAHHGRMLLATALVKVSSPGGDVCVVRALLDQGSEVSFATESLAQQLSLPRRQANVPVSGIGAGRTVVTRGSSTFKISSLKDPPFDLEVNALILPKLTDYVVDRPLNVADLPHLHGIQLADPDPSRSRRIDLILGVEVYNAVLLPEVIRGPPHTPIAQRTHLGWIVSGPTSHQPDDASSAAPSSLQCSVDRDLLDLLQRFWTQEEYSTN
ncbi:uncharacterized protein LOC123989174, partial [Osmia bicornis bicornis]|uniref:uncharacterized protein LOC123989174 n=1 Tax=Osmia bicornis bicornis TaxID=1437191 RepID=UPI001EAF0834